MNTEQNIANMLDKMNKFRNDTGIIGDLWRTLNDSWIAHTEMLSFINWCVDNWQCDGWTDPAYTEKFCNSPQCRRCSAKRILDNITE